MWQPWHQAIASAQDLGDNTSADWNKTTLSATIMSVVALSRGAMCHLIVLERNREIPNPNAARNFLHVGCAISTFACGMGWLKTRATPSFFAAAFLRPPIHRACCASSRQCPTPLRVPHRVCFQCIPCQAIVPCLATLHQTTERFFARANSSDSPTRNGGCVLLFSTSRTQRLGVGDDV